MSIYTKYFYDGQKRGSLQSARVIIPLILEYSQPESVIDVGCGTGTWLSVCKEYGINQYLGIDGDYIDPEMLLIAEEKYLKCDLSKPFYLDKEFDLVISLEVAEHIPENCADCFVNSLVKLGPVILFSAAIPFQGGAYHVNEQWPEYWIERFQKHGHVVIDCLRKKIWQNASVDPWYAQNIFIFVRKDQLACYPLLRTEFERGCNLPFSLVHPRMWVLMHDAQAKRLLRSSWSLLPPPLRSALKQGVRRLLG